MKPSEFKIVFKRRGVIVRRKETSTHIDKSVTPEKATHDIIEVEECYSSVDEFAKELANRFETDLAFQLRIKHSKYVQSGKEMVVEHGFNIVDEEMQSESEMLDDK